MLESLPDLPETANPSIKALRRTASRMTTVMDDLLLLSRMGNVDNPLDRERVDLVDVLREVLDNESLRAQAHAVTLRMEAPDDAAVVSGHPEFLSRLCANVVGNAVKYSRPGSAVNLNLARAGDRIVLTCADSGLGISEADQAYVFNEFFRSTNTDALGRPGTGLGLAIVARIVSRHAGQIELESTLGLGTTVRIRLPAYREEGTCDIQTGALPMWRHSTGRLPTFGPLRPSSLTAY